MLTSKIKAKSLLAIGLATCFNAIACSTSVQASSLHQKLSLLSEIKNESLPMMIDKDIRVDSTYVEPGKVFGYKYTMVNHSANHIDGRDFARLMRPEIVRGLCYDPDARFFRENKVSIGVKFYDRNRNLFSRVKVSPSECK